MTPINALSFDLDGTLLVSNFFPASIECTCQRLAVARPDPSIFTFVIDRLAVEPEEIWHVGDSHRTDVAGVKAAGLNAIWLNRYDHPFDDPSLKPDLEIHSLSDLTNLIAA